MSDKTLYDILELSSSASADSVRAAYERLSLLWDPEHGPNAGQPDAALRHLAVKEAFLTLANTAKRAQYDKKLEAQSLSEYLKGDDPGAITRPLLLAAALIVLLGWMYYRNEAEQREAETAKAVAAEQAKAAKIKAEADIAEAQAASQKSLLDARQRAQDDAAIRSFQRQDDIAYRQSQARADQEQRQEEFARQQAERERQRQDMQAASTARQQAAREKAELCRLERERYGRSISCY